MSMAEQPNYPDVGVHSGKVMTVLGPIPVEDLGVTLAHEHTRRFRRERA